MGRGVLCGDVDQAADVLGDCSSTIHQTYQQFGSTHVARKSVRLSRLALLNPLCRASSGTMLQVFLTLFYVGTSNYNIPQLYIDREGDDSTRAIDALLSVKQDYEKIGSGSEITISTEPYRGKALRQRRQRHEKEPQSNIDANAINLERLHAQFDLAGKVERGVDRTHIVLLSTQQCAMLTHADDLFIAAAYKIAKGHSLASIYNIFLRDTSTH